MRKRYGRKVDSTQKAIAGALRKTGRQVFEIEEPFDLLVDNFGEWLILECKTPETHNRHKVGTVPDEHLKMTDKQLEILELLTAAVLVAETVDEALNLVIKRY